MSKTRDSYRVNGRTAEELQRELNFLFQRMADRMDKIEGIRGTASIASDLDMNLNRVRDVANAVDESDALVKAQADLTGDTPKFSSLEIENQLLVNGSVEVYDENDTLIHSLGT